MNRSGILLICAAASIGIGCSSVLISKRLENVPPKEMSGLQYFLPRSLIELTLERQDEIVSSTNSEYFAVTNYIVTSVTSNVVVSSDVLKSNISAVVVQLATNLPSALVVTNTFSTNGWSLVTSTDRGTTIWSVTNTTITSTNRFKPTPKTNYWYTIQANVIRQPDPKQRFLLKYDGVPNASDKVGVILTPEGFLESVNSTNSEQSVEIAKTLALAAGEAFKASVMAPDFTGITQQFVHDPFKNITKTNSVERVPLKRLYFLFDPAEAGELECIRNALKKDAGLIFKEEGSFKFSEQAKLQEGSHTNEPAEWNGVVYRRPMSYQFSFQPDPERMKNRSLDDSRQEIKYVSLSLPNASPLIAFDVRRALGVTTATALAFDAGAIKSVYIEKPSELKRVADLPLELAQSATGVITNLVQFKLDLQTKQASAAAAQATALSAQATASQNQFNAQKLTSDQQKTLNDLQFQLDSLKKQKEIADAQSALQDAKTNLPPASPTSP